MIGAKTNNRSQGNPILLVELFLYPKGFKLQRRGQRDSEWDRDSRPPKKKREGKRGERVHTYTKKKKLRESSQEKRDFKTETIKSNLEKSNGIIRMPLVFVA